MLSDEEKAQIAEELKAEEDSVRSQRTIVEEAVEQAREQQKVVVRVATWSALAVIAWTVVTGAVAAGLYAAFGPLGIVIFLLLVIVRQLQKRK
jgi:hypothetical protein